MRGKMCNYKKCQATIILFHVPRALNDKKDKILNREKTNDADI